MIPDLDQSQNVIECSLSEGYPPEKSCQHSSAPHSVSMAYLVPKTPYLSMMEKWKNWSWIRIWISSKI